MEISTRRIRLFVTSLTLAALALAVVGVVLFQFGVREVTAAPNARPDGPQVTSTGGDLGIQAAAQALEVTKTNGVDQVFPGDTLTYTITITNTDTNDPIDVVVTDTLPVSTTYVDAGSDGWMGSGNVYTYMIEALGAELTETLTLTVKLADAVPADLFTITNTVEVADGADGYVEATDTDPVSATANLVISKTNEADTVQPGDVTYTITVSNNGDRDATGVVVTDTLPVSTTYVAGTDGWMGSGSVYTYSIGPLGGGYSETLTLTVTLTDPVPADLFTITNTVEVADGADGYVEATDTDPVSATANLVISKTNEADTVQPGNVTYTITVSNEGDRDATGVVVTDTLPQHTRFVTGTGDWEPTSTTTPYTYTYAIDELAGRYSETLTLTVALTDTLPAGVEVITNTVEVADDGEEYDIDTDDDVVDAAPTLEITKTDGITTVMPGDSFTYTITLTNTGNQEATGVVLTETLPVSASYVAGTGWQQVGSTDQYTVTIGSLGAGYSETLTLTVSLADSVLAGLHEITNQVTASDDGLNGPVATAAVTDTNQVDAAPNLRITKDDGRESVEPGDTLTYTLTIENVGNQGAANVVLTDTLPSDEYTDFEEASSEGTKSNGVIEWPIFDLPAGESITETVRIAVSDIDPWPASVEVITNTAGVKDDGENGPDLDPDDNEVSDVDDIDASPDLVITKDDGEDEAEPLDVLVYRLFYGNFGSQHANGVVITETLPHNTAYNAGESSPGWQLADPTGVYTYSVGELLVGDGGPLQFAVTVSDTIPAGVERITNTVQIADDGTSGEDERPGDNSDEDVTTLIAAPDLVAAKDDGRDSVEPGQLLTYTLTISNEGTQGATGLVITDTLPAATELITASHDWLESDGAVVWTDPELNAGDFLTRSVTVELLPDIPAGADFITNTVSVTDDGTNGDDPDQNNVGYDVDEVEAVPVLALLKMDGRELVKPGEVLTYTLLVKNIGQQAASDLIMTDTLSPHTEFITASDGGVETETGVVVWEGLELNPAAQLQRTVTAQVKQVVPLDASIVNHAVIVGPEGAGDTAQDVDNLVPVPNLILTKDDGEDTVLPGETLTYTLTVTNGGTAEATGIELTDMLPEATEFVTASDDGSELDGVATWDVGTLGSGEAFTCTLTVEVVDAIPAGVDTITNSASVEDDGTHGPDADPTNNTAEDETTVVAAPELSIAKTDGVEDVYPGQELIYTVTITNSGDQDASVVVTDTLPDNVTFVSASPGYSHNMVDETVVWGPFEVDALGGVAVRTVTVEVDDALPSGVTTITNTATVVEAGGLSDEDDDKDTVISAPDLRVTKTDGRFGARPGEILTYTLTVENLGTQEATGVVLSDTLPANTSFEYASPGGTQADGVVTWSAFTLDADEVTTRTVTVEVVADWPTEAAPILINEASVAHEEDLNADNDTDTDTTYVWLHIIYFPLMAK